MQSSPFPLSLALLLAATLAAGACGPGGADDESADPSTPPAESPLGPAAWEVAQDSTDRVLSITGFNGPEAVRYDPEADVFFVANFNGPGGERDGNGFISVVDAETGEIQMLDWATGTEAQPLHAPRGMWLQADTLWVADVDGVHGFHRLTAEPLAFVDFRALEPGFINDLAGGPDGDIYATDTGASRLYRITRSPGPGRDRDGRRVEVALADTLLGFPNGITWDGEGRQLVLVPWGDRHDWKTWSPETGGPLRTLVSSPGGRFDGVEFMDGRVVAASQADSTLRILDRAEDGSLITRPLIRVPGNPADIGYDTRRGRVAVPYIALDRVDIWEIPGR